MFLTKDQNPSRSFNVSILSPEQRRNSYFGEGGGRWRINRHVCRRRFGASVLVEENKTIQVEWSRRGFNERVFLPFFCRREKRGRRIGGRRLVIRCKQHLYSSATFWSVRSPPLLLMLTIYLLILPSELSDTTTRSAPNGHHHFSTTSKGIHLYLSPFWWKGDGTTSVFFTHLFLFLSSSTSFLSPFWRDCERLSCYRDERLSGSARWFIDKHRHLPFFSLARFCPSIKLGVTSIWINTKLPIEISHQLHRSYFLFLQLFLFISKFLPIFVR